MPKQKAKKKTPPARMTPPAPTLEGFGRFLRDYREHPRKRQQTEIARLLGHTQSLVAQLEAGKITNPDAAMIERIARAYTRPERHLSSEQVLAALMEHKYGIDPCKASLLTLPVKSVDQIADWEASVVADELWIVAPNFVDNENKSIRDAVVAQLRDATTIRYFVNEKDCGENGRFTKLVRKLVGEMGGEGEWRAKLLYTPALTDGELRWVTSSFVIANPGPLFGRAASKKGAKAEGYIFLAQDERPEYGFRMSDEELASKAWGLRNWLEDHSKGAKSNVEAIDAGKRA